VCPKFCHPQFKTVSADTLQAHGSQSRLILVVWRGQNLAKNVLMQVVALFELRLSLLPKITRCKPCYQIHQVRAVDEDRRKSSKKKVGAHVLDRTMRNVL